MFANLIGNAVKSLHARRLGVVEVGRRPGDPPVYYVRDTGVGIPREYHGKIFRAFQQVQSGRGSGEGMGLAIVQRVVERHGGRIWFESEPGVGSTFFFTLAPGHETSGPPQPGEGPS